MIHIFIYIHIFIFYIYIYVCMYVCVEGYTTKHLSTKFLEKSFQVIYFLLPVNIWENHSFPVHMKVRSLFLQWVGKKSCSRDYGVGNNNCRPVITTFPLGTNSHQHCNHYLEKDKIYRLRQMSIFNFFYKVAFFPVACMNPVAVMNQILLWKKLANLAVELEAI